MTTDVKKEGLEKLDAELQNLYTGQSPAKKEARSTKAKPKKVKAVKQKVVFVKSRRKAAVARAVLKNGTGRILINGKSVRVIKPLEVRELILEAIRINGGAKEIADRSDISINVYGGGMSGQAQAARTAIAKAIVAASDSEAMKKEYMSYDRTLLVDDTRVVEPKKFKGPKARARFQKSYR